MINVLVLQNPNSNYKNPSLENRFCYPNFLSPFLNVLRTINFASDIKMFLKLPFRNYEFNLDFFFINYSYLSVIKNVVLITTEKKKYILPSTIFFPESYNVNKVNYK